VKGDETQPEWRVLADYVAGSATPAETERVRRWLAADPAHQAVLDSVETVWAASAPRRDAVDVDAAWHAVITRRRHAAARPTDMGRRTMARIAAGLLVAAAVGGGSVAIARWRDQAPAREYVTARGQRLDVRLGDGTSVTLGVASRLRTAAGYGRTTRDVYLEEGEAYFAVEHDAGHPFAVHAGGIVARDVGTRFDVRAYPGQPAVEVAVAEGAVSLPTVVLRAGDVADIDSQASVRVRHGADVSRLIEWTAGRLVLADVRFRDALPELERWYDLDFEVADTVVANRHVTASFRDAPRTEALALLAGALHAQYRIDGRRVVFRTATERP
jgi:transmembrane sensor